MISYFECNSIEDYKMNEIVNKFLLTGDNFMPEMHLKQPGFAYSRVRNKRPGVFINFQESFHPRHTYSSHPVYLFLKLFPLTPFISDAFFSLPENKIMKK